jgi:uncharacterized membrane protein
LNIVKIILGIAFLAVLIVGIAGVVWLLKGNHPAVGFRVVAALGSMVARSEADWQQISE